LLQDAEIDCYMQEGGDMNHDSSLLFWQDCEQSYPLLAPLAEDLGHHSRNTVIAGLENRVFLKMNEKFL